MTIKATDALAVAVLLAQAAELQAMAKGATHAQVTGGYTVGVVAPDSVPELGAATDVAAKAVQDTWEFRADSDLILQMASDQLVRVKTALKAHGIELDDAA